MVNRNPMGYIFPQRGLRQGDPIFPYLFLIYIEGFSALIRNDMEKFALHGFRVTPNGVLISHLFFADDSILFCDALVEEAHGVVDVLKTYTARFGQEINMRKS